MAVKQMTIWGDWQVVDAAPEPPAWLDDGEPVDVEAIEQAGMEAMLMDWWYEQQQMYAIEDDAGDIIAAMMGAWS